MVGAMATASALIGVMNPLLAKLTALLEREYAKLKAVSREIAPLRDELSSMNTALATVSRMDQEPAGAGAQVKEWMRQLRELSYDAEDCIDVFLHRLAAAAQDDGGGDRSGAAAGLVRRAARRLRALRARHSVANKIAELKERALVVNDRRMRYELDAPTSSSGAAAAAVAAMDSRLPALFEEMDRLVGVDGPRDELVEWLTAGGIGHRRAVSIVGFGGLGKTTLANHVYQHIKSQFDCTAFVSVSRNPNINKVLTDIFAGVLETSKPSSVHQEQHISRTLQDLKHQRFEDHQLISMAREYLQHKRYLIIVDDIWSRSAWQTIKFIFPGNDLASRIITTTRSNDVAKACHFSDEDSVHVMKPLSSANSKKLFLKRIFGLEEKCPPELDQLADDILEKCDGLPLAIVNIASLLSSKPVTKQEWVWVLNSIGCSHEQDQESEELGMVKRILYLSYCDLPHHLKICFLYLSIFPRYFAITSEALVRRWIAEGFITEVGGQSLEEVGEKYFNELVNRNMIQTLDIGYTTRTEAYRVHDIMLDLIISLSTEENFATIMDGQYCAPPHNKIRRLSLQCKQEEKITWRPRTASFAHARSLTIFGDFNEMPPLVDLHVLRVLDLMYCSTLEDGDIENIASLFQLRYVRLGNNISKIPRQIGKLQLLQTLDLRGTSVKELPESIVQLLQLVCLLLPMGVVLPDGIGNMGSLQVLSRLDATRNSAGIVRELGSLTKLKDLALYWDQDGTDPGDDIYHGHLVTSLRRLGGCSLRSLQIDNVFRSSLDFMADDSWCPPPRHLEVFTIGMGCYFSRLPMWISSLSELTHLSIAMKRVTGEDLQVLERLPALLHLDLHPLESPKQTLPIGCTGFPCLQEFSYGPSPFDLTLMLDRVFNKKSVLGLGLVFGGAGAMPRLRRLELGLAAHDVVSAHGVGFDLGIHHVATLRQVRAYIECRGAWAWEVDAAVAAVTRSVDALGSCPVLEIFRLFEKEQLVGDEQQDSK